MRAVLAWMLVHGRAHRRPRASTRLHDLERDVDERIFERRVLDVVREDVALVPAHPLVAEVPHLVVCAGLGRVVARSRNADAAGVEPLCIDSEGSTVACSKSTRITSVFNLEKQDTSGSENGQAAGGSMCLPRACSAQDITIVAGHPVSMMPNGVLSSHVKKPKVKQDAVEWWWTDVGRGWTLA